MHKNIAKPFSQFCTAPDGKDLVYRTPCEALCQIMDSTTGFTARDSANNDFPKFLCEVLSHPHLLTPNLIHMAIERVICRRTCKKYHYSINQRKNIAKTIFTSIENITDREVFQKFKDSLYNMYISDKPKGAVEIISPEMIKALHFGKKGIFDFLWDPNRKRGIPIEEDFDIFDIPL